MAIVPGIANIRTTVSTAVAAFLGQAVQTIWFARGVVTAVRIETLRR